MSRRTGQKGHIEKSGRWYVVRFWKDISAAIDKMCASGLSLRTVNKYVEHVKQVVASLVKPKGEPIHTRTWNSEVMDLPIVEHSDQKRPSLKAEAISKLIKQSSGQEQALCVLLTATGMRVSEALALETKHFINEGRQSLLNNKLKRTHRAPLSTSKPMRRSVKSTCTPTSQSTCESTWPRGLGCCFTQQTGHPISTIIWKPAGSLQN